MKADSKYAPLHAHLRQSAVEAETLTFAEVERLLGQPLPPSARTRAWWSNRRTALQASAWMDAGYHVAELDLAGETVTFARARLSYTVRRDPAGDVVWEAGLIKALRRHMALTQQQFAAVLGVRQQTVSEWEVGAYLPTRASGRHLSLVADRAGFVYTATPD